jgi:hypothetical protein
MLEHTWSSMSLGKRVQWWVWHLTYWMGLIAVFSCSRNTRRHIWCRNHDLLCKLDLSITKRISWKSRFFRQIKRPLPASLPTSDLRYINPFADSLQCAQAPLFTGYFAMITRCLSLCSCKVRVPILSFAETLPMTFIVWVHQLRP